MNKTSKLLVLLGICFMFLSSGSELKAQQPQQLMKRANQLYMDEQYEEAAAAYRQVLELGYESPALYFNLGNSYFRLNKLGYSILYYEKARKLAPDDKDIRFNLQLANARTADKINKVPSLFIFEWWSILVASLTITQWAVLFIIFYIILLVFIGIYITGRSYKMKRISFVLGLGALIFLLLTGALFAAAVNREESVNYGILLEDTITAKLSPDQSGNDAFVIHEGVKFEIEEKVNEWSKIRLADGKVGWLPNDSFGTI